jgi:hypothetical protein
MPNTARFSSSWLSVRKQKVPQHPLGIGVPKVKISESMLFLTRRSASVVAQTTSPETERPVSRFIKLLLRQTSLR